MVLGAYVVRNKDALILSLVHQVAKGAISHCVNMWFGVFPISALVHSHVLVRVYRQWAIWIYGDQEKPRVCLLR